MSMIPPKCSTPLWRGLLTAPRSRPKVSTRALLSATTLFLLLACAATDAEARPLVWIQATDNAWEYPRERHSALVFDNRMWILGGKYQYCYYDWVGPDEELLCPNEYLDDVLGSQDGVSWTNVRRQAEGWWPRSGHLSVAFDNRIWLIGGRDVWYSETGAYWTQAVLDPPWSGRWGHASVVFDGKMWVLGGRGVGSPYAALNDVWCSTDGVEWTQASAVAGWSPRYLHSAIAFDGKIWVLGGTDGNAAVGDIVWSSPDGVTWTEAQTVDAWAPRRIHTSVVFDNKMWILGGLGAAHVRFAEAWCSSDGVMWTLTTEEAPWGPRIGHTSVVYDDKIWLMGGEWDENQGRGYRQWNDVWYAQYVPAALFSGTSVLGAAPLAVQFTDESISDGPITAWSWDFGDGASSTDPNPSHTYTNRGVYTVSLTVTSASGTDTHTKTDYILAQGPTRDYHSADLDQDRKINLSELLRTIQFFNSGGLHCDASGEDGYKPGPGDTTCTFHDSDYAPPDWTIGLEELLRIVQFYNTCCYHPCPEGEDGFCPGPG